MALSRGIKLRIVIASAVIILLCNLSGLEHGSNLTPCTQHFVKLGCVVTFTHVHFQTDFIIGLINL